MERRHQVFISSTFSDLQEERAEIIQALLELDCIPSGMELFPATNEGAWELIKGVIDDSDYYCLVIGARYGTVGADGIGYTEKEYDYAVSLNKPLMAFLHKDPSSISNAKSELTDDGRAKLNAFRVKVEEKHHCKYWTSADELGGQVSRGLINLRKSHPSDGWVPGKYATDESLLVELANLRAKNAELLAELATKQSDVIPKQTDGLAHGSETYMPQIAYRKKGTKDTQWEEVSVTWDRVLKYVGPALIAECSDEDFVDKLNLCFYHSLGRQGINDIDGNSIIIPYVVIDQIKIQLRALGQMVPGTKRRAVADRKNYWKLTPTGEARLISIQAISTKSPQGELLSSAMGGLSSLVGGIPPITDENSPFGS